MRALEGGVRLGCEKWWKCTVDGVGNWLISRWWESGWVWVVHCVFTFGCVCEVVGDEFEREIEYAL